MKTVQIQDALFVYNPYTKDGQGAKFWQKICQRYPFLPKDPIDVTTTDVGKEISKKKPRVVVIAGGDGTINHVCNVVSKLSSKPLLSIVPLGFGNALSYCLGVETVDKAITVLLNQEKKVTIDLMKTNIQNHEIGVFNISVGFDARIVYNRQSTRYIGVRSYVLSAFRSLIDHSERKITLTIDDDVTLTAHASSLVIANCPIIGQNYVIAPDAKLNDGLLECTLFSTKYAYITNLRLRGFKHPLYSELGKVRFKAKRIRVEGEPFVQIDGDPVMQSDTIEIGIMSSQVTFLRNSDKEIAQEYLPFVT